MDENLVKQEKRKGGERKEKAQDAESMQTETMRCYIRACGPARRTRHATGAFCGPPGGGNSKLPIGLGVLPVRASVSQCEGKSVSVGRRAAPPCPLTMHNR